MPDKPWYATRLRRLLMDMHVGDWDPGFLAKYDPAAQADLYERAGVGSAMFYTQSHLGLCYWPTKFGKMHASLHGRDVVGEMCRELDRRDIRSVAYFSVVFDNWAFLEHPDWRQQSAAGDTTPDGLFAGGRYGTVCPNHPEYRQYVRNQTHDLLGNYRVDGMFFDMTFWPKICVCPQCRERFRKEAGAEIPDKVDWYDPAWVAFASARERWMAEFAGLLTGEAKAARPGIIVYHNFATATRNWTLGVPLEAAEANDFLGADFYGDPVEQLLACKLYSNLSMNRPIEFMTSRTVIISDHEQTKSYEQMEMATAAAKLFGAAMLWIDAVNLDGTACPAVYDRVGKVFQQTGGYDSFLGGEAVEDIAVYFSGSSKMDLRENGTPLPEAKMWSGDYPHQHSVRGMCRILQAAHRPFGVITRKQLGELGKYKLLILPNVERMDDEEIEAVRQYVRAGGRAYASRYTSLVHSDGRRLEDFALADVFGAHLADEDLGTMNYFLPAEKSLADSIAPQGQVTHFAQPHTPNAGIGMLRLAEGPAGKTLAALSLPYAKQWGTVFDQNWASIHSSPPWRKTESPAVVEHKFGKGRCIYSAGDVEAVDSPASARFTLALLDRLLEGVELRYAVDTHPAVWANAFDQPEDDRIVLALVNYQQQLPAVPIAKVPFQIRPPAGKRFVRLARLPDEEPMEHTLANDGTLHATLDKLEVLAMVAAEYA